MTALKFLPGGGAFTPPGHRRRDGQLPAPFSATCAKACSDAEALEISLTENVAREDADELTYYEAYPVPDPEGPQRGEIARTFGKKRGRLRQSGDRQSPAAHPRPLPQRRTGRSDLQLLTMATKSQQHDWLNCGTRTTPQPATDLKGWLFGGAAIPTKYALFDLEPFAKKIMGDLFSEDSYFASTNDFWTPRTKRLPRERDAIPRGRMARCGGAGTRPAIGVMGFGEGGQEGRGSRLH